jgi:diguanylate cyclase (GGDEF)-like protein
VIVAGLDSLQRINEELGFRSGDLALRRCASRLRTLVGEEVLVARLGGDRFAVCLTGADRAAAEALAECITRSFAQTPVNLSEHEEHLVVSIGGCTTRAERRVDSLPSEAGRALEQARQSRPGSFRIVEISALGTSNGR